MAILGQNFQNSSVKVQYYRTPIDVFFPNFMLIFPLQRNASSLYPLQKTMHFRHHFAPLWPSAP